MNHAFSANRQASRNSGLPYRSQTSRTARMLAMLTGWPPPELLVTVSITSGTASARSASSRSQRRDVHVALEGVPQRRLRALRDRQVDGLGAGELDVGPGGVEVGVVRDHPARPADDGEQDLLGGPALVGGQTCSNGNRPAPRRGTGRTRASRRRTSLPRWMPAHCSADIAPVPESVSRSIRTSSARSRTGCTRLRPAASAALRPGGLPHRLDRVDAERLDDGAERLIGHRLAPPPAWRGPWPGPR